ncbi:PTS sugar transporter subunit IIA [[Mycobacterium] burgundiense]|uniref:Ascorbate-specific PTS system EIIA component n=1 Tax=[Mycobacterium] burgundiense TaxID=3064286 RepID=A0ABN9NNE7_9MYCO|nr:PTS sugar transporter subunit IIA [Mycolicibacterium sp. MU0053]CAJ1507819.1 PTS sugar transporter subunit IIA [Mycolicibacterium sp. MU0053]
MAGLSELLSEERIALDVVAGGWREAIRAAGALLEQAGIAESAYTDSMIANVESNGPYIVVAPGFAFAHARPAAAVHRTGMSWVRLADPVEFGHQTNDPVTLVVALAATDAGAHTAAMAELAKVLGDPARRSALDTASTPAELLGVLGGTATPAPAAAAKEGSNLILTVCGNGLGTSLFLKSTLEQVLQRWGWDRFITVEATDTISAKGKAAGADLILTSGEIAKTLGDVGIPVKVIENFSSTTEVDAAMRASYDV